MTVRAYESVVGVDVRQFSAVPARPRAGHERAHDRDDGDEEEVEVVAMPTKKGTPDTRVARPTRPSHPRCHAPLWGAWFVAAPRLRAAPPSRAIVTRPLVFSFYSTI